MCVKGKTRGNYVSKRIYRAAEGGATNGSRVPPQHTHIETSASIPHNNSMICARCDNAIGEVLVGQSRVIRESKREKIESLPLT